MPGASMTTVEEARPRVACRWCGMITPVGSTCEGCGSPMHAVIRCRYCRKQQLESVCQSCQEVLIRLWTIAQDAPESRFLFADVP